MAKSWVERVQEQVRGVEFYFPQDERNPARGQYTVQGPTSEQAHSSVSIEHAAALFLSMWRKDEEAQKAAEELARG